jgi:hypothetical protein
MMLNDQLGCCTIAAVGHAVQTWSVNAGSEITVPDSTVLAYYEQWDGYVSGDSSTDNGGVELDVLNDWKSSSFGGHKLLAYADPDIRNLAEVKQAINLFGGVYIGTNVTNQVMNNANDPSIPWDQTGDTSSAGGHAVFVLKYDESFLYFVSWGQIYKMTVAYWQANVDEAHALLAQDWMETSGLDPQGFNLTQLQTDLAQIK